LEWRPKGASASSWGSISPNYAYVGFMEYIDAFANRAGEKLRIFVMDQSHALRFVVQYDLFDGGSRKWLLDAQAVLKTLGSLAPAAGRGEDFGGGDKPGQAP
jgi:hypothetical protein